MDEDRKKFQGFGFWGLPSTLGVFLCIFRAFKTGTYSFGVEPPLNTPMAWRLILHQ